MQRRTLFATSILGAFAASAAKAKDLPALAPSVTDEVVPTADNPVLLNFNENSLGMSAKAKEAVVNGLSTAFRYPDQARTDLVADIAKFYGVDPALVTLGAGLVRNSAGGRRIAGRKGASCRKEGSGRRARADLRDRRGLCRGAPCAGGRRAREEGYV